jgi:hypothetical protein
MKLTVRPNGMTGLRSYGNPMPNPDALQEFHVETDNLSAKYERMSGSR